MVKMIKRFGKFGWVCVTVIVVTLAISLCVEAKNKKKKQRDSYRSEWVNYNDFYRSSSDWNKSRKDKKRNKKRNKDNERSDGYRSGFYNNYNDSRDNRYNSNSSGVRVESTSLTEVKINSRYNNVTKRYATMTVNFNSAYRVPNCVSYVLTSDMVAVTNGPNAENRRNYKFFADPSVRGCPEWYEYKGSGYDRGHMAPANDMRWSRQSMSDCFLMTNICPQDHDLNGGSWNKLELKIHDWARTQGKIVVATGPIFNGTSRRIGNNGDIVVPAGFFKVVLDPSRNRAIGFVYANHEGGGGVARHACSVDEVERITGHDFFSALPDNLEQAIESTFNFNQWN